MIEMKTLTIGEDTFEIVDEQARNDINTLESELEDLSSYDLVLEAKGLPRLGNLTRDKVVIASGSITDTFEKINAGSKANIVLIHSPTSYQHAFYTAVAQEVTTSTTGEKRLHLTFTLSEESRLTDISITVYVNNESIGSALAQAYAEDSKVEIFIKTTNEALDSLEENVALNTQQISDITPTVNILKPMIESTGGSDTLEIPAISEDSYIVMDMLYHISDATPTMSDFANGCVVTMGQGGVTMPFEVLSDYIIEIPLNDTVNGVGIVIPALSSETPMFWVVPDDNLELVAGYDENDNPIMVTFEKKGIYAVPISMIQEGYYWVSLQIPNYLGFGGDGSYVLKNYVQKDELEELTPSIVQAVLAELQGNPVFGVVDAENNITISGNLADGTYTLKYENEDGTTTEIGTFTVGELPPTYTNLFNPAAATLNKRWSDSGGGFTSTLNGYVASDYIAVKPSQDASNPTILRFRGGTFEGNAAITFFDSTKKTLQASDATTNGTGVKPPTVSMYTDENGDYCIKLGWKSGSFHAAFANTAYIRIGLAVNTSGTAITTSDIQNIIITIDEPITD